MSAPAASLPLPFGKDVECVAKNDVGALFIDNGTIAWFVLDRAGRSVNTLSPDMSEQMEALFAQVERVASAGRVRVVVFVSAKRGSFIVGADVHALYPVTDSREAAALAANGQAAMNRLEALKIPTLAAINGVCLGGGLEFALACHYRVCASDKNVQLGLPEIKLGLLPGAGGTVRLPRLVGFQEAVSMILPGASVRPDKARRIGLVDAVIDSDDRFPGENRFFHGVREYATKFFDGKPKRTPPKAKLMDRLLNNTRIGRYFVAYMAERQLNSSTKGRYPAPYIALDTLSKGMGLSVSAALANEAQSFGKLAGTSEHKNLLSVFLMSEEAKKRDAHVHVKSPIAINRVGVIGAGVMGSGIAQLLAHKNLPVFMKDIKQDFVDKGLAKVKELFDKLVAKKRMSAEDGQRRTGLVKGGTDNAGFSDCAIVIEAAVENMKLKQRILGDLVDTLGERGIFATNTSSLSITELQSVSPRPGNVVGMHFFNPVHLMPLVEIVRGKDTSDEAVAAVYDLTLKLGKYPVIVNDGPGFLVNRILGIFLNEATRLLSEGAAIEVVDKALMNFGMPLGAFRLIDEVGMDVGGHVAEIMHHGLGERFAPPSSHAALMKSFMDEGRLGKKTNKGFYAYKDGKTSGVDASVQARLNAARPTKHIPIKDIVDRSVLMMVNEAALILHEGIVKRAEDVDLGMVFGTGFPPFRGGLLQYADHMGIAKVIARMKELASTYGPRYEPCEPLMDMHRKDSRFFPKRPFIAYEERTTPRARL